MRCNRSGVLRRRLSFRAGTAYVDEKRDRGKALHYLIHEFILQKKDQNKRSQSGYLINR
jgi:hypothetical protein